MFKVIAIIITAVVAVGVAGYVFTMSAGKPISTNLSIIGQGKPALVLAYENYSPTGGEALNRLRKVRKDYDSRLEFVVAEIGTPQGRSFADRYQLFDGQAVFLKQNGEPLQITGIPADEQTLRTQLDTMLTAVE